MEGNLNLASFIRNKWSQIIFGRDLSGINGGKWRRTGFIPDKWNQIIFSRHLFPINGAKFKFAAVYPE
ncbi:MAG: hypothetical protein JWM68_370 [Verrucomicrobiales bacterium]|nr:hypothetical protein [Verrucomicrobiales bacterium]